MRQSLKRRLAAVEAVASPKRDIDSMSLPELEALADADTRLLIEAAGSVDAAIAHMRQEVGDEGAAALAAWAQRLGYA
jgi:hypothetical protein